MRAGRDWGRWPLNVRFGSKADIEEGATDVALPPKADILCSANHVRLKGARSARILAGKLLLWRRRSTGAINRSV